MLGHEHRVPAHRRLLAVVCRLRGRQALLHEIAGMLPDYLETARVEVGAILGVEPKARPEG